MTPDEALKQLGVKEFRKLSERTTTIEFTHGGVVPATPLELRMYALIKALLTKH